MDTHAGRVGGKVQTFFGFVNRQGIIGPPFQEHETTDLPAQPPLPRAGSGLPSERRIAGGTSAYGETLVIMAASTNWPAMSKAFAYWQTGHCCCQRRTMPPRGLLETDMGEKTSEGHLSATLRRSRRHPLAMRCVRAIEVRDYTGGCIAEGAECNRRNTSVARGLRITSDRRRRKSFPILASVARRKKNKS